MVSQPKKRVKKSSPFTRFLAALAGQNKLSDSDLARVDTFVSAVNPKLKLAKGYQNALHTSLQICYEHCNKLFTQIPHLEELSPPGYRDDPAVNPIFAGAESIDIFLKNAETKLKSVDPEAKNRFALLTMTEKDRTFFGNKQQGSMVVADAAMQAVTFSGHRIEALVTEKEQLNEAITSYFLKLITGLARERLAEEISNLQELKEQREMLRTMQKMGETGKSLTTKNDSHDELNIPDLLEKTETDIKTASDKSANPDKWLNFIVTFLAWPETLLRIETGSQRLDWANVLTPDPAEKATRVTLATFIVEGERDRKGVILHYRKA